MAQRPPTRPLPTLVSDGVPEIVDAAASQTGRITQASKVAIDQIERGAEVARSVRDAISDDATPPDGSQADPVVEVRVGASASVTPPRRRRPGWGALISMCMASMLAGDPIWDAITNSKETAQAAQIGRLQGHLAALEGRLNSNAAADLKAASDKAVEFRELDGKIIALGANLELVMTKLGILPAERHPIPTTAQETINRHKSAEEAWSAAVRQAQRRQVEQAIADSGTVAPP